MFIRDIFGLLIVVWFLIIFNMSCICFGMFSSMYNVLIDFDCFIVLLYCVVLVGFCSFIKVCCGKELFFVFWVLIFLVDVWVIKLGWWEEFFFLVINYLLLIFYILGFWRWEVVRCVSECCIVVILGFRSIFILKVV